MKKKRAIVSVISDLISDQRVHKVCTYLYNKGFNVTLIGRCFKESPPLEQRVYHTQRIRCYFKKGIPQYAEFNIKLFITLLWKQTDIFLANDLDTLVPNFLQAFIRKKKLVYDSHEYFTGTPELQKKPLKKKIWKYIEKRLLPKVKYVYTVNKSIADLYKQECGVQMKVVRNVPFCVPYSNIPVLPIFPKGKFILLLQGAGINKDRGAEELIECMRFLPPNFFLVLIGGGDVWMELQRKTIELALTSKILFISKVPFDQLHAYTKQAHLGLSLDKPTCQNHQLILPNKLFDYMHAHIPVLASDTVEVNRIIGHYKIGMCIEEITPELIANAILWIYNNKAVYNEWKQNTARAARDFCWEKEQQVLDEIFDT